MVDHHIPTLPVAEQRVLTIGGPGAVTAFIVRTVEGTSFTCAVPGNGDGDSKLARRLVEAAANTVQESLS